MHNLVSCLSRVFVVSLCSMTTTYFILMANKRGISLYVTNGAFLEINIFVSLCSVYKKALFCSNIKSLS